MLGLKLNHVSKRGYRSIKSCLCRFDNNIQAIMQFSKLSLGNPSSCCWLLTHWGREKWTPFRRRHFQMHFLECKFWISIKISLKFVPKCPINNIAAIVQIMAWRRPGDNSLSEPMVVSLPTHICVTRPQWVNCGFSLQFISLCWKYRFKSLEMVFNYYSVVSEWIFIPFS